ncbi:NAD-P-binding protein [Lenzites betulinus]|nr:NAD-P-binding protein [Lenzites betulinus]
MSTTARPTTWLVTGANRGIGLEIVRQLLESPANLVVAASRKPEASSALSDLKKTAKGTLHIVQLDIGDFDSIRTLPKTLEPILGEVGLDYLINNAAIFIRETAFTVAPEDLLNVLRVNTVGPAFVSQVLLPFLEKGSTKKILNISSSGGSIEIAGHLQGSPFELTTAYAVSKAGLNMLTYKQKLEKPDFTVIALCPGWVKTDMGGDGAVLEPQESIAGILKLITSATPADSGKYLRYNGETIPW